MLSKKRVGKMSGGLVIYISFHFLNNRFKYQATQLVDLHKLLKVIVNRTQNPNSKYCLLMSNTVSC